MTETPTDTPPPPPPPPTSGPDRPRPLLVRRRRGRMLAGVASGLARHLRVDVTLVRIGFVILAFTGGAGILGYLAGWVLLPEEDDDGSEPVSWTVPRGASFWVGVGLLVVATIVLVEHTTPFGSSVGTPLVLIAVGVALWKVSQDRADRPPPPVPDGTSGVPGTGNDTPPGSPGAASAPTERMDAVPGPAWTPPPVPPRASRAAADWTPPASRRPRSILGRLTLGVLLLAVGGGVLLEQLDLIRFTALDAAATALFVVGLGLVVGTWFGRARGLILLGVLLVPFVLATGVLHAAGIDVGGGAGEHFHTVSATDELLPEYSLGAGLLQLDLSGMDVPDVGASTDVRLGAGEIVLLVPEDTNVVVDASVQLGAVELPRMDRGGAGITEHLELRGSPDTGGTLHIDARLGVGQLTVRMVPTPEDPA
ncbi:MAG: PspC domain-containing protein [Actinobacteria bacterium]|nr:PspC domain-containing protein [Actinomycetota bacterium]